ILATVVPVNNKNGDGWQQRLAGLLAYNDWVRQFAGLQRLDVLDLEAALRVSVNDRSLRTDLDSGDGLHLDTRAYEDYLNPIMMPMLLNAFGETSPPPDTTPPQPVSALTARPGNGIATL
ncbi:MAG: hypothetical protein NT154_31805, partial [Verrucomicrobia bacterium]|nr:hypothetical protein [Verrucomicrobiota bacterium]